jgi:hypothetical protein
MFTVGVAVYMLAIGVAFLNAYAFLALQAALAVYYALDPVNRRPGRGRRAAPASGDEVAGDTGLASTPGRFRRRSYGPGRR